MPKVASWRPLNVEYQQEAEDDVDDTQEIQIEEALKLYQIALKFHSEGPPSLEKTAAAYRNLFASEVFQYNESLSEFKRHEEFGESLVFDSILEEDFEAGPAQVAGAAESAPNTLPQILHLSYKNHGQFLLESMQHWVSQHGATPQLEAWNNIRGALNYFAEALDKEDTDLDLWLRAASVSAMLGSKRLTRYCLEAVLDGNDEPWENLLRLPGLEEGFAGHQLRALVERLEDNVSLMQTPLSSMKRKKLSETMKKRLNPYPFAPLPADVANAHVRPVTSRSPERIVLTPSKWDWASIGESILQQHLAESQGLSTAPGCSINFNIPPDSVTPPCPESEPASADIIPPPAQAHSAPEQAKQPASLENEAEVTPSMNVEEAITEDKYEAAASTNPPDVAPAPSRKRSTDSAGLPETADGARSRSKRIRARDVITEPSAGGDGVATEGTKQLDEQLERYTYADQCLYEIVKDIYARLGVEGIQEPSQLRNLLAALPPASSANAFDKAACDMYMALQGGNGKVAQVLLSNESFDLVGVTREAGLNAFLGYAKPGAGHACTKPALASQKLGSFAHTINGDWLSTKEVAFAWMEFLLSRGRFHTQDGEEAESSYMQFKWADDLKRNLVQIIVNLDEHIYERMLERIANLDARILSAQSQSRAYAFSDFDQSQVDIVETLFELHLDIYSLIKHPHSQVDVTTQTLQSDRLERWSTLARDMMQFRSQCVTDLDIDTLSLRHIWATVFQMSVDDDVPPEHVVSAIGELKSILEGQGDSVVQVQNNAIMPELCVAAVDRELVRISMKDFFLKVFDHDEKDPVTIIESLEPILENCEDAKPLSGLPTPLSGDVDGDAASSSTLSNGTSEQSGTKIDSPSSPIVEMRKFLDSANVNVRVSLWHRLREAYEAIDYPPKVLSCYLRIIETFAADFTSTNFQELPIVERQVKLLTRFRVIDDLVTKTLQIIKDEKQAFNCLSFEHVQSSMSAIAHLLQIMSAADMFRDLIRIGRVPMPRVEALPSQAFVNMSTKLDDMHIRLWMVQYHMLREALSQDAENFPTPSEDLFEFIRHVHHATGVRHFCHMSGRQLLRLEKDEVLRFDEIIDSKCRETELCQVLHDLYGLKLFTELSDCQDFLSTPDVLDKKTALSILPFVISQAGKFDIKDLPKTELRTSIDKVHAALGRPKHHKDLSFNHKLIAAWIKSAIYPASLFSCLKGVGVLSTKHVKAEEAAAASLGWYYLMGNISLNKFRSQKRMTQGPTEDLSYAQAFFLQDLEFSVDRWETWYRLAQVNDLQLEEAVSWNADKLNSSSADLVNYQRGAINCYTMAVAAAVSKSDAQAVGKVAQMYTEFGNRMYASSREPFHMDAFQFRDNEKKFCNPPYQTGVIREETLKPLYVYTAWKLANALFKRAVQGNSNNWWNYYMLGKCSWKMWEANEYEKHNGSLTVAAAPLARTQPSWAQVTDAIINAIDTLPGKKGRSGEPVLEPHYKLVSITHKLFLAKSISQAEGVDLLSHTSYSQNVPQPESAEDWNRYILGVLKSLRSADKSSWHHRIIARSAHIIFEAGNDAVTAHGAKHELTQQMFTKTMAVQVWKPENERPGRHFVYTTRYTRFFVDLLILTEDKVSFEALAKRVRRKTADFFDHPKLWQDLCIGYLSMLRNLGGVQTGQEDSIFKSLNHDEFNIIALRLEAWCQSPVTQHPMLDILRDAIELKRLNNGLLKPLHIDDLIGDTYALLYTSIGLTLPPLPTEQQQRQETIDPFQPAFGHPHSTLSISSLMQVQVDGTGEPMNSGPFAVYHPNQLLPQQPPQQLPQPEPAARPRAKAVGRREVGRRAEACIQKPVGIAAAQTTAMPIRSPPAVNATLTSFSPLVPSSDKPAQPVSSITEPPTHPNSTNNSGTGTATGSVTNDEADPEPEHEHEPEPSAPASVHDDADDESELSELDEEEVQEIEQEVIRRSTSIATPKSLFPNLKSVEKHVGRGADASEDTIHERVPSHMPRLGVVGQEDEMIVDDEGK